MNSLRKTARAAHRAADCATLSKNKNRINKSCRTLVTKSKSTAKSTATFSPYGDPQRFLHSSYWNTKFPSSSKFLVPILKVFRTLVIGLGIYGLGKQAGISEYAQDPIAMEKSLSKTLISGQFANGEEPKVRKTSDPVHKRVDKISHKILQGARDLIDGKIERRMMRINLKKGNTKLEEELAYWQAKRRTLKGTWHTIVICSPLPNAFVSDITPRKIYVNEGLLTSLECSDDELGERAKRASFVTEKCETPCEITIHGYIHHWTNHSTLSTFVLKCSSLRFASLHFARRSASSWPRGQSFVAKSHIE